MIKTYIFLIFVNFVNSSNIFPTFLQNLTKNTNISLHIHYFTCNFNKNALKLSKTHLFNDFSSKMHISSMNTFEFPFNKNDIEHKKYYIVEGNCNATENLILFANTHNLFLPPHNWIFINVKENLIKLLESETIGFWVDSNIITINNLPKDFYLLNRLYKVRSNNGTIIMDKIKISRTNEYEWNNTPLKQSIIKRKNVHGSLMRMSIVVTRNTTFANFGDRREKYQDIYSKTSYILFQHIGDLFNATIKYYFETTWGYRKPDGTYDGMVGRVFSGQADFGGTAFFINKERIKISTFISRMKSNVIQFVFKQPKLSDITNLFVLPFALDAWLAVAGLMLVLIFCFFVSLKWYNFKMKDNEGKHELLDSFGIVVAAISQQGSSVIPEDLMGSIVMFVTYLAYSILFVCYSANIVSLLQSPSNRIKTLEDMYKSSFEFYKVSYMAPYYESFVPEYPKLQQLIYYERKMRNNTFGNFYEGVKAIRTSQTAFITDIYQLYALIDEVFTDPEKCGLDEMQFIPENSDVYMPGHKESPYLELLKIAFSLMHENGLTTRTLSMYITKKPKCHSKGPFESAEFKACYPLIMGFIFGICLSVIILILEHIIFQLNRICQHVSDNFVDELKEADEESISLDLADRY